MEKKKYGKFAASGIRYSIEDSTFKRRALERLLFRQLNQILFCELLKRSMV